jgi:hypothetical protein
LQQVEQPYNYLIDTIAARDQQLRMAEQAQAQLQNELAYGLSWVQRLFTGIFFQNLECLTLSCRVFDFPS